MGTAFEVVGPLPDDIEPILQSIRDERAYQDAKWGKEFDARNTINDWVTYIHNYAADACAWLIDKEAQKRSLIKVAALAVAAIQRCEENGGFAPRHYDE